MKTTDASTIKGLKEDVEGLIDQAHKAFDLAESDIVVDLVDDIIDSAGRFFDFVEAGNHSAEDASADFEKYEVRPVVAAAMSSIVSQYVRPLVDLAEGMWTDLETAGALNGDVVAYLSAIESMIDGEEIDGTDPAVTLARVKATVRLGVNDANNEDNPNTAWSEFEYRCAR